MNSAFRNVLPLLVVGAGLVGLSSCADPYGYGGSSYSSYNYSSYPYGYTRNALPYGYNSTYIGGTQYWHCNDHYYRHYPGRGYVVVQRPAGRSAHYDRDHRNDDHKDYTDRRDDRGGGTRAGIPIIGMTAGRPMSNPPRRGVLRDMIPAGLEAGRRWRNRALCRGPRW